MYWPIKLFFTLLVVAGLGSGVYFAWPHISKMVGGGEKAAAAAQAPEKQAEKADIGKQSVAGPSASKAAPANPIKNTKYEHNLELAKNLAQKDPIKARKIVENILKDPDLKELSPAWIAVALTLTEANRQILFTDVPSPEKETYIVEPGNSLARIAKHFNTTPRLIAKSHRIDLENPIIRPGQTLRIWKGYWNIKVSKSKYMLLLYDGDRLVMAYRVGLGKQNRTPEGKFQIIDKTINPDWYRYGKKIPFGDPANPLGTRWMKLKGVEERTATYEGYGIHGTWKRDSIGGNESNGCIRMLNEQVEELFDILPPRGTPVVLIP